MVVLNSILSGSFSNEGQSSLLYSRHIKMLPDLGMVKMYPKCPEAGMNVDVGCYNVMKYIPSLFLKFSTGQFSMQLQLHMFSETQCAIPTSLYFFCENVITPLVPILL